jgi:hypothetical protein
MNASAQSPQYDQAEAKQILNAVAEELAPDRYGRDKAADQLLTELVLLNDTADFYCGKQRGFGDVVLFGLRDHGDVIVFNRNGAIGIKNRDGRLLAEVPLAFDRVTGRLEGLDFDEGLVPVPGSRRQRRSALAVLVEVAAREVKRQSEASRDAQE